MQKTIWIINQYSSTPQTGMGGRHYYLARELSKQGYKVYLIAASYTHLLREPPAISDDISIQPIEGLNFVWIRTPDYPEAHSKKRILNWIRFSWMLRKLPKIIPDKPDAILYSSPSLVGYLGAQRLSRRFHVPLTFEVRDIWPLTLTEVGGYSTSHPFIRFLQWIEDKAYRDSDRVISNLKNAVEHMTKRGMPQDKFSWVPNGFSLGEVASPAPLPEHVRSLLPNDKFIIGYTGTLGLANALEPLLEAAERLKAHTDIAFVLVGGGKEKPQLQKMAHDKALSNVIFIESIPKAQIQSMLACFDVCFIGWRNESLYRFGIGANKLPEYFYAGRPVLHAYSGQCDPVCESGAGISVPSENPEAIAKAVLELRNMSPGRLAEIGRNGREYAFRHHEYEALAADLATKMFGTSRKNGTLESLTPPTATITGQ